MLGSYAMGIIARITRSSLLEVLSLDYIRPARAKGLAEQRVVVGHALCNTLIPTVTVVGLTFGSLLAGAVLTEAIFSWPGLGRYAVDAATKLEAFPSIVLAMAIAAALGPGLKNALIAIVVVLWPEYARLMRAGAGGEGEQVRFRRGSARRRARQAAAPAHPAQHPGPDHAQSDLGRGRRHRADRGAVVHRARSRSTESRVGRDEAR